MKKFYVTGLLFCEYSSQLMMTLTINLVNRAHYYVREENIIKISLEVQINKLITHIYIYIYIYGTVVIDNQLQTQ